METVVEEKEHDERGSQSASVKDEKGVAENPAELKDALLELEERDNSISESKSQHQNNSQAKIESGSIEIPAQSKLNKTQKMTDLKNNVEMSHDNSMKGRTQKDDQINQMILKSQGELNIKESNVDEPIISLNIHHTNVDQNRKVLNSDSDQSSKNNG